MNCKIAALVFGGGLALAWTAQAEPWVDWSPTKGVTEVTTIKVDPNHIDDYLTGLSKDWAKGEEMAKRHGVIDDYFVAVKVNAEGGPNVVLIQHFPSFASLDPDKARDQALLAEGRAAVPKDKEDAIVAGYDKYRTFVSDEYWTDVEFAK